MGVAGGVAVEVEEGAGEEGGVAGGGACPSMPRPQQGWSIGDPRNYQSQDFYWKIRKNYCYTLR